MTEEVLYGINYRLSLDLQFFADGQGGEKTEPATPKKLEDARKEGQVAKSKEIANGLGLIALFLVLKFWVAGMGKQFLGLFSRIYNRIPEVTGLYGGTSPIKDVSGLLGNSLLNVLIILAPFLIVAFVVAFVCDLAQVKWKPSWKIIKPKFKKLNPLNGFKRIFSANSLVELVKSLLKIFLIAYVSYSYLKGRQNQLFLLYDISMISAVRLVGETVINLGLRISFVYLFIAATDYAYQKFKFAKDMRMTKQEIKDEFKNSEGNPEIKGRIRRKMQEASQRRMMQNLPKADVVITNPTHYAVAIQYNADESPAPIVIAKGEDYLAQKIKEVAKENDVEIVENKPLARMLYANVDVGAQIPPELYSAVAEVLAYVYHLKGKI